MIRQAIMSTVLLALLLCAAYPLAITGLGSTLFPHQAGGSLVMQGDKVAGSELIGQTFTGAEYFHSRPSAAGDKGYDSSSSSGSNFGPTSKALAARLQGTAATLRTDQQLGQAMPASAILPVDMLTTSGSGLDPHISPAGAMLQAARVAAARNMPLATVEKLVRDVTEGPEWGLWGDTRVNVLRLNKALNAAFNVSPNASLNNNADR